MIFISQNINKNKAIDNSVIYYLKENKHSKQKHKKRCDLKKIFDNIKMKLQYSKKKYIHKRL